MQCYKPWHTEYIFYYYCCSQEPWQKHSVVTVKVGSFISVHLVALGKLSAKHGMTHIPAPVISDCCTVALTWLSVFSNGAALEVRWEKVKAEHLTFKWASAAELNSAATYRGAILEHWKMKEKKKRGWKEQHKQKDKRCETRELKSESVSRETSAFARKQTRGSRAL